MQTFNLYQKRRSGSYSHITSIQSNDMNGAIHCVDHYFTTSKKFIATPEQQSQITTLEDNLIDWSVDNSGGLIALAKMSTWCGDDCSEWIPANEMIEQLDIQAKYFKS